MVYERKEELRIVPEQRAFRLAGELYSFDWMTKFVFLISKLNHVIYSATKVQ